MIVAHGCAHHSGVEIEVFAALDVENDRVFAARDHWSGVARLIETAAEAVLCCVRKVLELRPDNLRRRCYLCRHSLTPNLCGDSDPVLSQDLPDDGAGMTAHSQSHRDSPRISDARDAFGQWPIAP